MRTKAPAAQYDIIIVGGGLVGASFALLLQQMFPSPLRVLVIEAADHPQDNTGQLQPTDDFDVRTTALSWGSRVIYEQAGLWPEFDALATAIQSIHVSDKGRLGAVKMSGEELDVPALGYVLENRHLGTVLLRALQKHESIDLLSPAQVKSVVPRPDGMHLAVSHREKRTVDIHTSFMVLADGGKSDICRQLGINFDQAHYQQQALISNVAFTEPHRYVAYERFTDAGPMAVLPLPDMKGEHRGALIWTLPGNQAVNMAAAPEDEFLYQLQQRFGYRLGRFVRTGKRACFPLTLSVAREQVRPGLVLLGNVAHTLHPVAGQGLNLALRDTRSLVEHIVHAVNSGISPGDAGMLQDYVRSQQRDQDTTIAFSHHITGLFAGNNPLKVWSRKFGLFSIDLMPPVKKYFTRQAMGMADRHSVRG